MLDFSGLPEGWRIARTTKMPDGETIAIRAVCESGAWSVGAVTSYGKTEGEALARVREAIEGLEK